MPGRRLTQRQKKRIQHIQDRRRKRLESRLQESIDLSEDAAPQEGRVVTRHGSSLAVECGPGELYRCRFRQNLGQLVCGDRVVWQPTGRGEGVVTALLPRDSVLSRPDYSGREKPLAANISQLVVVLAPQPEPSEYLVDQYLVAVETMGVRGLLAINKIDLLDDGEKAGFLARFERYARIGYPVVAVSAKQSRGLAPLETRLQGETSILVGQSGVGKSSLINALLPDRGIQTGRLSQTTGLGRHTTSATTLYSLPTGGELIDSPGVRSFRLTRLDRHQLAHGFREFGPYIEKCRFSDCSHQMEPDCALKQAVRSGAIDQRRLDNFLHLAANLGEKFRSA